MPGVIHDPDMSPHIAAHMRDREHITLNPKSAYLDNGKLDTLLVSHEIGHRVGQHMMWKAGDTSKIPELQAFRGEGYTMTRGAGNAPTYENPFGISTRAEELLADAYSELLHQGKGEQYEEPDSDYVKPRIALLKAVAKAAADLGLPDKRLYRFRMEGSERFEEASYKEIEHPRGRKGQWVRKLGLPRLVLKADKKLTKPQVRSRVQKVADAVVDFYGGEKVKADHEPEYLAAKGVDAQFRHEGEILPGRCTARGRTRACRTRTSVWTGSG